MSIEVCVNNSVNPLRTCIKSAHWAHCMYRAPLLWNRVFCSLVSVSLLTYCVFLHSVCFLCFYLGDLAMLFRLSFCIAHLLQIRSWLTWSQIDEHWSMPMTSPNQQSSDRKLCFKGRIENQTQLSVCRNTLQDTQVCEHPTSLYNN